MTRQMDNFASDIEEEAGDEPILQVLIGFVGGDGFWENSKHLAASAVRGRLLSWTEAKPLLNYSYYTGYGSPDCHAIYAWTETKVLFVVQYDGATVIESVPRNPTVKESPIMPGG